MNERNDWGRKEGGPPLSPQHCRRQQTRWEHAQHAETRGDCCGVSKTRQASSLSVISRRRHLSSKGRYLFSLLRLPELSGCQSPDRHWGK